MATTVVTQAAGSIEKTRADVRHGDFFLILSGQYEGKVFLALKAMTNSNLNFYSLDGHVVGNPWSIDDYSVRVKIYERAEINLS